MGAATDAFNELMGVVAISHVAPTALRAAAIGQPAAAAVLGTAARYPFAELVTVGSDSPVLAKPDRRLRAISSPRDLPPDWKADVIGVAVPGLPDAALAAARAMSCSNTVVVVAVDRYDAGPAAKRLLDRHWRVVIPYHDYLPEPHLFLLASDSPISRKRPIPAWTRRLSEGYLPALFRFPKNEYGPLFAGPLRAAS
jgi:hypothetical protein